MLCKLPDCEKPTNGKGRGWCPKHYTRFLRHGDPEIVLRKGPPPGERRSESLSYKGAHHRIKVAKGKATEYVCEAGCGNPAQQWSLMVEQTSEVVVDTAGLPYSGEPDDYRPLCVSCHKKYDLARLAHVDPSKTSTPPRK